ncbi:hypothetical protein JMJ77_0012983 [Colletotrichum scovillei]|uniref:Uncharacterized protein n=1 Tax=Colletotrichum scovillei TaxID=1209932 RepID=A0A9P7R7Y2_9PEZI|nr:hypothetical protein JMJ77_0012983 [Colletotrichum scovillei]KAG7069271.1 hypothetical protein JMJ76_0002944 [Colletotrichum scovillei]KAG7073185.1 hypothetical protein JMJ78_0014164 [Colletotrichum scovillei]
MTLQCNWARHGDDTGQSVTDRSHKQQSPIGSLGGVRRLEERDWEYRRISWGRRWSQSQDPNVQPSMLGSSADVGPFLRALVI